MRNPAKTLAMSVVLLALSGGIGGVHADGFDDAVQAALARIERASEDPFELPAVATEDPTEIDERRRLAISRSILTLHSQVDTTLAVLEGDVLTMLSLARNTRHLGLRARALSLYDLAALADREHRYVREIGDERLTCAIELGDSASVVRQAFELSGRADAASFGPTFARALRFLVGTPAVGPAVGRLVDRLSELGELDDVECWIQIAHARQVQQQHAVAHSIFRRLVMRQDELDDHQTVICLMGLADSALASGDSRTAGALYRAYRDHDAGRLSAWSTYQLGSLAASAGELDEAVALLRSICEREEPTPWRETACVRLAQVRELLAIEAELRPYGRDLRSQRKSR